MLDYDFKIEYRPGKTNISDYTSRHPLPLKRCTKKDLSTPKDIKQYVHFIVTSNTPRAISKLELVRETE